MKYSIRNTLILIFTLLIMAGGGWIYIHNLFNNDIDSARTELMEKESEIEELRAYAEQFPVAQANYNDVLYKRLNFPKELLRSNSPSDLYHYLQLLNTDLSLTGLNYSFQDSVLNEDHGMIFAELSGEGEYENLVNFLYRIEYSRPLVKVLSVSLENSQSYDQLNTVFFTVNVAAYYRRGNWSNYYANMSTVPPRGEIEHNPYYPLIHDVPPNDENLPDVDNSRIVALTGISAHIVDQNGDLKRLQVGDRVYLGNLREIDIEDGEAIFVLNRGGIVDRVVLTLQSTTSQ
ncbi:MAG: hypothetical protein GVY02_01815 [Bacteroidetes bacterium]|jgi:hypothetical protein|nr:hypothetical protein [Bacteroidota bacterium]